MPKVKDFKEKVKDQSLQADMAEDQGFMSEENEAEEAAPAEAALSETTEDQEMKKASRRRPATEKLTEKLDTKLTDNPKAKPDYEPGDEKLVEVESFKSQGAEELETETEEPRVQLNFYGKDWVKEKAPEAYRSMEIIADEWVKDGKFEGLPVGHPLLQFLASKGLQKAKQVEKKLEEKGVFFLAKTGVELVKSKVQEIRKKG